MKIEKYFLILLEKRDERLEEKFAITPTDQFFPEIRKSDPPFSMMALSEFKIGDIILYTLKVVPGTMTVRSDLVDFSKCENYELENIRLLKIFAMKTHPDVIRDMQITDRDFNI